MHPYEMIQTLRSRGEGRWVKLRAGSLYHQVERLTAEGLTEAVGVEQEGNRPPRTTYRLTDRGRDVLMSGVSDRLATVENPYLAFSLALGQVFALPPQRVVARLTDRLAALQREHDELEEAVRRAREQGAERIWLLAHEHMLALLATEREYVSSVVDDIESKELTWPE